MQESVAEYGVAAELYPLEYLNLMEAAQAASEAGRPRLAVLWLRRALEGLRAQELRDPGHAPTQRALAGVLLRLDSAGSALGHARRAVDGAPRDREAARVLAAAFLALGRPDSARAVWPSFLRRGGSPFWGWLLRSSTFATVGMQDSARLAFDSARVRASSDSSTRAELRALLEVIQRAGTAAVPK